MSTVGSATIASSPLPVLSVDRLKRYVTSATSVPLREATRAEIEAVVAGKVIKRIIKIERLPQH
jgi:hypothetical protein